ncbi:toll/interleukin-1 receptor (TIR) domain-containing protein [Artemisia annua]|uniref:Toll/interleukin-1 receptor (TIR) domain-containing protein n=1 Tax=Artemisia annua TaxID=35608 RepID=A0A2U1PXV6_ARTAN|nr:toll/interleukin-1 receptor (TIR) domain-containing protein [Artemisia annua]
MKFIQTSPTHLLIVFWPRCHLQATPPSLSPVFADQEDEGEGFVRLAVEWASIIILSKNYATSRWCLDELCLILEQRHERDHYVLPIFYHVDPSHVRKQEGTFQINVVPDTKWTDDNVKRWKAALEKVGQITGNVAISGPETIFLGEVVDIIKERLDLKQVYCQRNLVGMETRDKEINSWLEQSDSDIFAIWGMPGSGKTTLARHIVYSNWHKFESVSILQDIGTRSTEQLRQLQEKLIIDIIEGKERTVRSVWQGTDTIEDALQRKKALIVLDNIVTKKQLDALIGTGIKTQSKIIITTRQRNSSKWFQSTSWRCQEHEMKLLDDGDSLELLSLYAFEPNAPINGYEELLERALVYCQGNPLALEVLGSSLNRGSQEFWESTLTSYEREFPGDLKSVLITSYNLLQQSIQQQLFLHIACFFIGKDKDYVEKILGPDYCAKSEIVNLTNSCLLAVSPNNKLMMHQLLQAMARTIVDDESHTHPGNRSRVWRDDESHNVLIKKKGSTNVKGLALDMEVLGKQRIALGKKQVYKLNMDVCSSYTNKEIMKVVFTDLIIMFQHLHMRLKSSTKIFTAFRIVYRGDEKSVRSNG